MTSLLAMILIFILTISPVAAQELRTSEIEKLFPNYISILLEQHDLIITGQEREVVDGIISALDQNSIGKSDVFTPEYVRQRAEKLSDLRKNEVHKAQLASELEQFFSFFKKDPESLKCIYTKPEYPPYNKGSVACRLETKPVEGCAYGGRISLQVDPATKRGVGVYRSPIIIHDTQYSSYFFSVNCPG